MEEFFRDKNINVDSFEVTADLEEYGTGRLTGTHVLFTELAAPVPD